MSQSKIQNPKSKMLESLLEESGAILRGHFLLTSGRHSDVYFEKFRILENPELLSALCSQIPERFREAQSKIQNPKSKIPSSFDLVAGPTTGGIIVAFEVARQLGVKAVYVESEGGVKKLRRGASVPQGARVLVVDDVLTTGKSVRETIEVVRGAGGEVAGVGVLIDRSEEPLDFGCPLFAAHKVMAKSYAPDEVPDWLAQIPLTKPGTRTSPEGG